MQNIENKKDKFIFTDSFRTKDVIWDAYTGFIDNYNDYVMLKTLGRSDPITIAAMNKYAYYFYDEVEDFLENFKEIETLDKVKKIFKQERILDQDYQIIRKFFAKFMSKSGIKNIVKDKDEAGKSIEQNR